MYGCNLYLQITIGWGLGKPGMTMYTGVINVCLLTMVYFK